jgi:hypothetical protein
MTFRLGIYYYAIVGCLGGLLGWFASEWVLDVIQLGTLGEVLRAAIVGAVIGACACATERVMAGAWMTAITDALLRMVAGGVGGAFSGYAGQELSGMVVASSSHLTPRPRGRPG